MLINHLFSSSFSLVLDGAGPDYQEASGRWLASRGRSGGAAGASMAAAAQRRGKAAVSLKGAAGLTYAAGQ